MSVVDLSENFRLPVWYSDDIMELKPERKKQTEEYGYENYVVECKSVFWNERSGLHKFIYGVG